MDGIVPGGVVDLLILIRFWRLTSPCAMANFYHVICLQYVLRRVGRCRCRCKMQTDADDQSTARILTNDPDEDRRRPLSPSSSQAKILDIKQ